MRSTPMTPSCWTGISRRARSAGASSTSCARRPRCSRSRASRSSRRRACARASSTPWRRSPAHGDRLRVRASRFSAAPSQARSSPLRSRSSSASRLHGQSNDTRSAQVQPLEGAVRGAVVRDGAKREARALRPAGAEAWPHLRGVADRKRQDARAGRALQGRQGGRGRPRRRRRRRRSRSRSRSSPPAARSSRRRHRSPARPSRSATSYATRRARRRTGGCGSARRSRARTRSRSGSGSRTPRSGTSRSTSRRAGFVSSAHTSSDCGPRASSVRSRYESVSPESTMSSTTSTLRPAIGASRSLRMRTTPELSVPDPYELIAMKSHSLETVSRRIRSPRKKTAPLSTPISSRSRFA